MIERKTKGSIVCPKCGRLVSANAKECIHCGKKNPGLWGYGPVLNKLFIDFNSIVQPVILVCATLYFVSVIIDPSQILGNFSPLRLFSPSGQALIQLGMTGRVPIMYGRWWTTITAIYLHGGLLHIIFNMLWLRNLGAPVEQLYGVSRSFIIFTISGVTGFLISHVFGVDFTIGASGSIFGLLGALVYYGRKRGGVLGNAIYKQVGTWAIVMFLFGFIMPNLVNNWAHAGGFIGGAATAYLVGFQEFTPETQNHRLTAFGLIIFTIICFGFAFFAN
jgi:rhomboid protease GluP